MATSIWKSEINPDYLNQISSKTMVERIGIRFLEVGDDYITASMPVDERTKQPMGLLHGGASAVLIETLGSVAATWCVGLEEYCVGVEINANHVRAVKSGTVIGKATPIHRGSRIQVWQVEIRTEDDKLVSIGRLTLAVQTKRTSAPS